MAFITDEDYDVQVHTEVIKLLDNSSDKIALRRAESMAMDLMRTRLSGRYDTSKYLMLLVTTAICTSFRAL